MTNEQNLQSLVTDLDLYKKSDTWKEISYEYEERGRLIRNDIISILAKNNIDQNTAHFIFRTHTVDYGVSGIDFWKNGCIVREAIFNPQYDMQNYIKKNHSYLLEKSELHTLTSGRTIGSNTKIIPQEKG